MLIYAVIGFGSIALVALGELSGVEAGSALFNFYLKLVFGGFLVFYSVLFHFAMLGFSKRMDEQGPRVLKYLLGEQTSRVMIVSIAAAVLVYWIYAFGELMKITGFRFI